MRHIALVGMMGSGKSETGRKLALRLGRRFVDCDRMVVRTAGCSIPEIFEAEGEAGFRRRESATLAEILAGAEPAVVATGGGVVTVATNRDLLATVVVCWLRVSPEVLANRVGDGSGRPMLAASAAEPGVLGRLRTLCDEREGWYGEVAEIVVDADDLSAAQAATAIAARLGEIDGWADEGAREAVP